MDDPEKEGGRKVRVKMLRFFGIILHDLVIGGGFLATCGSGVNGTPFLPRFLSLNMRGPCHVTNVIPIPFQKHLPG